MSKTSTLNCASPIDPDTHGHYRPHRRAAV